MYTYEMGRMLALPHGAAEIGPMGAVRNAEGLVQVEVAHVRPEVARTRHAHHGVHVRAVHVHLPAVLVDERGDVLDVRLEHAVRARIRDHQGAEIGRVLLGLGAQVVHVDVAVGIGLDHHHREAGHDRRRRVGAVRRLRNEAHCAVQVAARLVIGADDQQARVLALRAGVGLQ
jgi:hypothetical protein